jgi:hypothetical protein
MGHDYRKLSAQKHQNAEDTAILYNIEAHKKQRQK